MTGTSLDGLDAALVEIDGRGLELRARLVGLTSLALDELAVPLRALAEQQPMQAGAIARTARALAALHVEAVRAVAGETRIDLVAVHGQTVFHQPPVSWQLCNPAPIAYGLGVPVVFDLRAGDLANGGQGAPITPIADWLWLRDARERRVVINLGGFCNLTVLPVGGPETIGGGDVCACNQVLDLVAREALRRPFDEDGAAAARGSVHAAAHADLAARLRGQSGARRSLGTGDELRPWLDRWVQAVRPDDLARTACAAVAAVIAERAVSAGPVDRLVLAGGGVRNRTLVAELARQAAPAQVTPSDDFGLPAQAREAAAMAVLGALCQDRVAITLPQITGVRGPAPIAGCWVLP